VNRVFESNQCRSRVPFPARTRAQLRIRTFTHAHTQAEALEEASAESGRAKEDRVAWNHKQTHAKQGDR
jgi:hypothetical protein